MVLDPKETTLAYRCPACGQTVVSVIGIFALSGDMIKLKCSCGHSELLINYTADRRVRLNVPCLICGTSHPYVIASASLFERDLLTLSCGCCGVDICFIGSKEKVLDAAATADRELLEMMEEAGMQSFDELQQKEDDIESNEDLYFIEDILNFILAELEDENKIHCDCHDGETPIYRYRIIPGEHQSVEIFCERCGATLTLPVCSISEANALLNADSFILKTDQTR